MAGRKAQKRGGAGGSGATARPKSGGNRQETHAARGSSGGLLGRVGVPAHVLDYSERFQEIWRTHRREIVFVCLGLIVLAFLAFGRAGSYGFIDTDDDFEIYKNPHVKDGFVPGSVLWAFTETKQYYWEPLTYLSHILDCQMFGLNAGAHHLVSIGLHAFNGALLFLLLLYMTGSLWRCAWVAALFTMHPLRVESVIWLSERRDVLSGLFTILTLLAYVYYAQRPESWKRYGTVIIAFWLALMSKPMAVTVPVVMLILDYWPLGRLRPETALKLLLEKIPLFVSSAVVSIITVLSNTGNSIAAGGHSFVGRLASAIVDYTVYLGKLGWPYPLAGWYPHVDPGPIKVAVAALVLGLISAAAVRYVRRWPWFLAGWLWFLITMLPVIGMAYVADRFTYVALIGPCVAGVWLVSDWFQSRTEMRPVGLVGGVVVLIALSILSWRQTGFWKDSLTVFGHTLAVTKNNRPILCDYAAALAWAGRLEEAVQNYREAIRLEPARAETHESMAEVLDRQGKVGEAIAEYRQALALQPENVTTLKNLSMVLIRSGGYMEAMEHLRTASRLAPNDPVISQLLQVAPIIPQLPIPVPPQ